MTLESLAFFISYKNIHNTYYTVNKQLIHTFTQNYPKTKKASHYLYIDYIRSVQAT